MRPYAWLIPISKLIKPVQWWVHVQNKPYLLPLPPLFGKNDCGAKRGNGGGLGEVSSLVTVIPVTRGTLPTGATPT